MKFKQEIIALLIFFFVSLAFVYPVFQSIGSWGIHDWDQHFMYNAVPRTTILEFNQFPLWNPYYCGGNAMLANPQSSFLNPMYIFVMVFGEVTGLKILIPVYLMIGLFGMFLLARHLNISLISSYLSAFLFMLSGMYAVHLSVGHAIWVQMALMPFIFLFYLKSLSQIRYVILSALFMAFIFLGGGLYPLFFIITFLAFYSVFLAIKEWRSPKAGYFRHLKNLVMVFLLFALLSSVKLAPMLAFTSEHSFEKKDVQHNDFKKMIEALTFRDAESRLGYMYDYSINGYGVAWGWHEYHAYIGFLPLLLFLAGSVFLFRKEWPLVLLAVISFLIAWGDSSIINIWGFLRQFPLISDLHGPSRFLAVFVFSASLVIGKFTSIFEDTKIAFAFKSKKFSILKLILILVAIFIFIDLFLVNSHLFKHSFVKKPLDIEAQEFAQVTGDREKSQYPIYLANLGILTCFDRVKPQLRAAPKFDTKTGAAYANYIGEAYIFETNETQQISYFSPNKVKVKANESGILVLNQNYAAGWKVKNNTIKNVDGLIGAHIEKGQEAVFYYLPGSFVFGSVISAISFVLGMAMFFRLK